MMSRLGEGTDVGREAQRKDERVRRHHSPTFIIVIGAFIALTIAIVLVAAAVYSLVLSERINVPHAPEKTTTTTTIETTTTSTTTTTSSTTTTATLPPTTQTTTTTTMPAQTTTTVRSSYQIAACMADKTEMLYIGDNPPSIKVEKYLAQYLTLFRYEDCKDDNKDECIEEIRDYIEDDNLFLNTKEYSSVGLPVLVKDGSAYLIPSVKSFEGLLECGSLD